MNLFQNIISGDQSSLRELYENYGANLYGIIFRITKDEFVASSVLQKTFLKIWNNCEKYDSSKSSAFTWMSTIARNTAIDAVRLKGFQNSTKTESFNSTVHNTEVTFVESDQIDASRLLDVLDEKYRIVLNKIYLEGYTHKDLSDELGLPIGTIKTRLRKAISILRDELKDETKLFLGIVIIALIITLIV